MQQDDTPLDTIFQKMNTDKSGELKSAELIEWMGTMGIKITDTEASEMLKSADTQEGFVRVLSRVRRKSSVTTSNGPV